MRRKILRIENPFDVVPQRRPNFRQCVLAMAADADIRRLQSAEIIYSGHQVDAFNNGVVAGRLPRHRF